MEPTKVDIQKLKSIELDMLKEFIKVCDKLNLTYFAIGGTLLGAVRHGGYIPWDDDIDIGMPRKDFDIFVKEAQKYMPDHLFVQTRKSDPEWITHFCKIRNKNTLFMEDIIKHLNINHGVFIDIFPLDRTDRTKKSSRMKMLSIIEKNYLKIKSTKRKIKCFFCKLFTMTFTIDSAYNKLEKEIKKENGEKITVNYFGAWGNKEFMDSSIFENTIKLKFEDLELSAPAKYDEYLKTLYGDYMTPPPEDKRGTHHYLYKYNLDGAE